MRRRNWENKDQAIQHGQVEPRLRPRWKYEREKQHTHVAIALNDGQQKVPSPAEDLITKPRSNSPTRGLREIIDSEKCAGLSENWVEWQVAPTVAGLRRGLGRRRRRRRRRSLSRVSSMHDGGRRRSSIGRPVAVGPLVVARRCVVSLLDGNLFRRQAEKFNSGRDFDLWKGWHSHNGREGGRGREGDRRRFH